jgi:hypothetical protein
MLSLHCAQLCATDDFSFVCFFRRGAAQLKGVCLYGKLNYYIGKRAKEEGRRSLFPSVDVSGHVHYFTFQVD